MGRGIPPIDECKELNEDEIDFTLESTPDTFSKISVNDIRKIPMDFPRKRLIDHFDLFV